MSTATKAAGGVVTESLRALIARQVDDHGIVVWYDPERVYGDAAATLDVSGATVARYDGSFLTLRREIDGLMNGLLPPKLVSVRLSATSLMARDGPR